MEKNSKTGGYLDEMDLPPCISDEEGGEWVEEEDEEDVVNSVGDSLQGMRDAINLKEVEDGPLIGELTIST